MPRCEWKYFPVRFVVVFLAYLSLLLLYALRVNMSVAVLAMRKSKSNDSSQFDRHECYANIQDQGDPYGQEDTYGEGEFDWDEEDQGLVLASFSYLYILGNLLGGWLSDKFGGRLMISISLCVTAILNLLTPLAARASLGALVTVRILEGFFEGPSFPAFHTLISRWIPVSERGLAYSIVHSGSRFGAFIALSGTGALVKSSSLGGWPTAFYVFGGVGLLLSVCFLLYVTETPAGHPCISSSELDHIQFDQEDDQDNTNPHVPWRSILTSLPVWVVVLVDFGEGWGFSTVLNDLPSYMKYVLLFDTEKSGVWSSLPFLLQVMCSWISGYVSYLMIKRQWFSTTAVRKILTSLGLFCPALCLVGVIVSNCNRSANVAFFAAGVGLVGVLTPGFRVSIMDMAPSYAGTIMGISNGLGNISGFLAPHVVSLLTQNNQTLRSWHIIFGISIGIYLFVGISYILFGTSKLQPWGLERRSEQRPIFMAATGASR